VLALLSVLATLAATLWADVPAAPIAETTPHDLQALATEVQAIFQAKCADCHGPDATRRGGTFGDILPLTDLVKNRAVLTPGDSADSILWWEIEDNRMPPQGEPPLTAREKKAVQMWIDAGAPTQLRPTKQSPSNETLSNETLPDSAEQQNAGADQASAKPVDEPSKTVQQSPGGDASSGRSRSRQGLLEFVGQFHVVVLHFPIALVIVALLAELIYSITRATGMAQAGRFCLWMGTFGAAAATVTGWAHLTTTAWADNSLAQQHALFGYIMLAVAIAALVACEWRARSKASPWTGVIYWTLLVAAAALVGYTAHLGGVLVHGPIQW